MKRNAQGAGTIRQRADGRWEARYTVGRNPGTGRQIQKSVYGATQKEVMEQLRLILTEIDTGTHTEPSKLTLGAWLDIWAAEYLNGVKDATQAKYRGFVKNHIKPALGAVKLQKIKPHQIQGFYNSLQLAGLSAKTVRDANGALHAALEQAKKAGYIHTNPTEACTLPRWVKKEMNVLDDATVSAFLQAIQGDTYEAVFFIDLFTGLRQSEALGLTWDAVDFKAGTITVSKQLLRERKTGGKYYMDTTKNDKVRKIKPASIVMNKLKARQRQQMECRLKAGPAWSNPWNLVFTNEIGQHLAHNTVRNHYKEIVRALGQPDLRFHDMRHSYAVIAIMSGDDIKTIQGNLGHHTAAFTLDQYGHITERMQEESAARMDAYIKAATKEKA